MAFNFPAKQDVLVSGTNIKTINSNSLLGSGNLTITGVPSFVAGDANKVLVTDGTSASWQYAGLGAGSLPSNTIILGRDLPSGMTATSGILIGTGSNLGTGTSQVVIGASSGRSTTGATGANNTVVGASSFNSASLTSAANNVIIGQNNGIAITTSSGNVFIGKDCAKAITTGGGTGGNSNVAIGQNALSAAIAGQSGVVAIGDDAATNATINNYTTLVGSIAGNYQVVGVFAVCIGHRTRASGSNSTAIGTIANCSTFDNCVAVGQDAQNTGNQSVALGKTVIAAANQFVCGGNNMVINTVVFGRGWNNTVSDVSSPLTITNSRVNTGYTNIDGSLGTLTLTPSNSTGTGVGGDLILSTAGTGSSGTTANSYVERIRCKALTEVVVNDTGVDFDFRVEGDTDANLLFVDAGTDRVGVGTATPAEKLDIGTGNLRVSNGNLILNTAGKGLTIKEGTNAKIGVTGAFPGGGTNTVTVSTTAVTSNSIIFISAVSGATSIDPKVWVSTITAGTSFVISSGDNSFTGTVGWMIVERS